ncbi:MAG: hypothetical protein DMD71_00705 [Gemmatimonadetes bacterium]|nr:MAG: hypothetical protein DMD71_00705 [Gemmatimonadota bacterium]
MAGGEMPLKTVLGSRFTVLGRATDNRKPRTDDCVALLLATLVLTAACTSSGAPDTLRFWAFGREGEVVAQLVRDFEREHPGVHVRVQQIPWSAAHEKLLTAHVGGALPDMAAMGNTWVPEMVTLGALAPLDSLVRQSSDMDSTGHFPGIWATNAISWRARAMRGCRRRGPSGARRCARSRA